MADEPTDSLRQRILQFLDEPKAARGINGTADFCVGTTVGATRNQNQDRAVIVQAKFSSTPERDFVLGVVADGMGGLSDGDKAATIAISVFTSRVIRASKLSIVERLRQAAFAANEAVFRALRARGGTTISAMLVGRDERAVGLNVGDSRIYGITKYRDLRQLSRDDTLGRMLGSRQVDPLQKDKLVQFVGLGEGMEPHIVSAEKATFGSLLISTDGIHGALPGAIAQLIKQSADKIDLVGRLVSLSELVGSDNGTVIAMPTHLTELEGSSTIGIELNLWSSFGKLEIWIPSSAEYVHRVDNKGEPERSFLPAVQDLPLDAPQAHPGRKPRKKTVSEKRSGKRQKKRKELDQTEDWLPIDEVETPPLDISFPERRRR